MVMPNKRPAQVSDAQPAALNLWRDAMNQVSEASCAEIQGTASGAVEAISVRETRHRYTLAVVALPRHRIKEVGIIGEARRL